MPELGTLERIDLREVWESEAGEFTPWLAQDENIGILGDSLGMELDVEAQEKDVGPFRADILCRDTNGTDHDSWVLIENQLEPTDHKHLGQLLTYAAGLRTVTIIWIAQRFTDEHRAALDWLNEITGDRYQFFGLEVELWRIGHSPAAPKFNIVAKPNEWTRSVGEAGRRVASGELSPLKLQQQRFWVGLASFLDQRGSLVELGKPAAAHWITSRLGKTGIHLETTLNSRRRQIGVEAFLTGDVAKPYFWLLKEQQEEIEAELGVELEWRELPKKTASRIITLREDTDPTDEADWPIQYEWVADMLERFDRTFRPRAANLDASEWRPPSQEDSG